MSSYSSSSILADGQQSGADGSSGAFRSAEVITRTSQILYTQTTSGRVIVVTSVVTAVITTQPASGTGGGKSLNGSDSSSRSFFSNTGAVAGTFAVVGLVSAALLAGLALFFFRRKRARQLDEDIRVAAGGAGDGGAGVNRFSGEDDDEDDPYLSGGSDTHGAYAPHQRHLSMTSYGGGAPASAGAAEYYASGRGSRGASPVNSDQSHAPQGATFSPYNPGQGPYGGAAVPAATQQRQRSSEGILYADWAEYVDGTPTPGSSGEASPQEHGGSAEGMSASFPSPLPKIGRAHV